VEVGTIGVQTAGVERALWIGSPHLSKWKAQVFGEARQDVEPELVGEFDTFAEYEALAPEARARLRYFFVTHGNDAVGYFGPDLLIQQPSWLGDRDTRPPRVPKGEKWRTPTSFFQTLIDMKNAKGAPPTEPGEFVATGHDYSGDLARFVQAAFGLTCSDEQLERIEKALRRWQGLIQAAIKREQAEDEPPSEAEHSQPPEEGPDQHRPGSA